MSGTLTIAEAYAALELRGPDEADATILSLMKTGQLVVTAEEYVGLDSRTYNQRLKSEFWIDCLRNNGKIYWASSSASYTIASAHGLAPHIALGLYVDKAAFEAITAPSESRKVASSNSGGRPGKWDWEGAAIEMARYAHINDADIPKRNTLNKLIADWFVRKTKDQPSDGEIRDHVKKFHEAIWPTKT